MKRGVIVSVLGAFVGILFFVYIYYSEYGMLSASVTHYLIVILTGVLCASTVNWETRLLNKWLSWKKRSSIRLMVGIVLNTATVALIAGILIGGALLLSMDSLQQLVGDIRNIAIKFGILILFSCLVYNIIYFALFSYNQYSVVQIDALKSDRHQLQLQFEALKSQLSPHYLFNSLNTISSLIYKDPMQAENFIRRLAQSYDYILTTNNSRYVTLNEEIEFVHTYNYLLQVRFQNNIHFEINIPDNILDSKIPPLTLQMLVENAVKHNVISSDQPLHIYISALDNTDIKVINTKTEINHNKRSFNIGLSNIRKRYQLISDRPIRIEDGEKFTVSLPVIQQAVPIQYHLNLA